MNDRIKKAFAHGKAFLAFITAGDPNLETTERLVLAMAQAGADLIELGLPFSDPVAEGPVIQQADERALAAGTTTDGIFEMAARLRAQTDVALAIMTYVNPVFVYGPARFFARCAACGIDAVIVPDLPFEEKGELAPYAKDSGTALISLIAPTSHERITTIAREAEGFVYCVSSLGVTGVRSEITTDLGAMVALVRAATDLPCAVGFGISTPEQAQAAAQAADGVIVGSAIVRLAAEQGEHCVPAVAEYVRRMKAAISE